MNYILHILIMIGIYSILIYSLNLTIGYSGLLTFCHAAFYGIGAYAFTLISIKFNLPFIPALSFAIIFTGLVSFLLGFPALRFRGDSFVLVTFGFQMIIFTILYNWISLTRGPYGIPGIPRPVIVHGITIDSLPEYFLLVLVCNLIFLSFLLLLYSSPFGLVLKSLRDDERLAESLRKPPFKNFLYAFTISGAISAVAGALYASYVIYIDPTSFGIEESIFQVSILLLGGSGNIKGPFVGVLFMVIFPEILRFLGLPDTIAPNVRQMIYGALLITLMFIRPKGLAGEFVVK